MRVAWFVFVRLKVIRFDWTSVCWIIQLDWIEIENMMRTHLLVRLHSTHFIHTHRIVIIIVAGRTCPLTCPDSFSMDLWRYMYCTSIYASTKKVVYEPPVRFNDERKSRRRLLVLGPWSLVLVLPAFVAFSAVLPLPLTLPLLSSHETFESNYNLSI